MYWSTLHRYRNKTDLLNRIKESLTTKDIQLRNTDERVFVLWIGRETSTKLESDVGFSCVHPPSQPQTLMEEPTVVELWGSRSGQRYLNVLRLWGS